MLARPAARAAAHCRCQAGKQQQGQRTTIVCSSAAQPAFRKHAAAGLAAAALLLSSPAALADGASGSGGSGMVLSFAPPSVKQALEARDEAASYQCVQMFDCDGDRRDYAKKQWEGFVARGGVPERKAAAASEADGGAVTVEGAGPQ